MLTHEQFIMQVAQVAVAQLPDAGLLDNVRIVYGAGQKGLRGVTFFNAWQETEQAKAFVEVCAFGEENPIQLAGTIIHELGHVLAGPGAGHSAQWKQACQALGLRRIKAAGTEYLPAMFAPAVREQVAALWPKLETGKASGHGAIGGARIARPCSMGIGTRGGTSRGTGSGSRMRKWECGCGVIVRVARDNFAATCDLCSTSFKQG